jgi:hypothetical protein
MKKEISSIFQLPQDLDLRANICSHPQESNNNARYEKKNTLCPAPRTHPATHVDSQLLATGISLLHPYVRARRRNNGHG